MRQSANHGIIAPMLEIIYEDSSILICKKAAGIATQTPRVGDADMVSLIKSYRAQKGEDTYLGVVHRLDQPVEGVMAFAKDKASAASLSAQIQNGTFEKYYYAVVLGQVAADRATLEDYLLRDGKVNVSSVVAQGTPGAKFARLFYETVSVFSDRSLLRVKLDTGRHHQIRVQLSHAGHPLIGDKKYGQGAPGYLPLALCAYHIGFTHPKTHAFVTYDIPPSGPAFSGMMLETMAGKIARRPIAPMPPFFRDDA